MAVSGATDLSADDWMQTDFLTLKAVFSSCNIVEERWLSSFSEEETLAACGGSILIGDPTVQRVRLPLQAPPVESFPQCDLLRAFTEGLTEMAKRTTDEERLLVIVCCHGQRLTGSLAIGQHAPPCASSSGSGSGSYPTAPGPNLTTWSTSDDLNNKLQLPTRPDVQMLSLPSQNFSSSSIVTSLTTWFTSKDLAQALQITNAPVTVITSSCYAGKLRNPATFSLLAGSTSQELSDSLSESESGNCRGGRFVYALTDSLLAEFGMRLPTPVPSGSDSPSQRHLLVPTVPSGTLFTDDLRLHRSTFLGRKKHVDEHPMISCRQTKMTMIQQDGEGSHLPALPLPNAFPAVEFAAANPSTEYDSNGVGFSKTASAVHYWKNNHYYDTKANNVALHKRIRRFDRGEATSADRKALRRTIKLRKFMNFRAQSFVKKLQDEGCALQTCAVEIEQWVEPLGELVKESGTFWSRHVVVREWLENPHNAASISSADHYPKPALYAYVACKESGFDLDAAVEKVVKALGDEGPAEQNMSNMSDSGVAVSR